MKIMLVVLAGFLLGILLFGGRSPDQEKDEYVEAAELFLDRVLKEEYEEAVKDFDAVMARAMPSDKLELTWRQVLAQAGAFRERTGFRRSRSGGYEIVFLTCSFRKADLDVRVVFNGDRRISGLFFSPAQPPYSLPEYAGAGADREEEVTVGEGPWALPGTLARPAAPGPHPALVLVHGSGPNDRDETLGPNKPFRDISAGLAARGIAVLRYDKRTRVHGKKMSGPDRRITVREETVEDAARAVRLLRKRDDIREDAVFVLGHSLGGMLIPRIFQTEPGPAGFIVMAGAVEPLEDAIVRQLEYISGLDGKIDSGEEERLREYRETRRRIKALTPADLGSGEKLLGAFPAYWLDLRGYAPPAAARAMGKPLLILQGGRDYQVTREDFEEWRTALMGRKDASFRLYPDLNHLFIPGTGRCTPAEYRKTGHVAREVIEDIAAWIMSVVPPRDG